MEIKGKIIQELTLQQGQGKKGLWLKQEYIIETEGQYPKKVCLAVWNDKIDAVNFSVGDQVTAHIELESREYNGRWYTEVKVWKGEHHKFAGPKSATKTETKHTSDGPTDDLPF